MRSEVLVVGVAPHASASRTSDDHIIERCPHAVGGQQGYMWDVDAAPLAKQPRMNWVRLALGCVM